MAADTTLVPAEQTQQYVDRQLKEPLKSWRADYLLDEALSNSGKALKKLDKVSKREKHLRELSSLADIGTNSLGHELTVSIAWPNNGRLDN